MMPWTHLPFPRGTARSVGVAVLNQLRDDIISGLFQPEERLRFESLRERYGVGVSTLREALSVLTAEGLVSSFGQKGFAVAAVSAEDYADVTETRTHCEALALRYAMQRGGEPWRATVRAAFAQLEAAAEGGDDWGRAHWDFHVALVSGCGSQLLMGCLTMLADHARRYRQVYSEVTDVGPGIDEHRAVVDAIESNEPDVAAALLIENIRRGTAARLELARRLQAGAVAIARPDTAAREPVEPPNTPREDPGTGAVQARDALRDNILSGRLGPGKKLRPEILCKVHGVSIGTVREALVWLTAEGLVQFYEQRGFSVRPVSHDDLIEVVSLLQEIDTLALRLSIEKGDDEWEARMVAAHHLLSKVDNVAFFTKLDNARTKRHVAFHIALGSACGSQWLFRFRAILTEHMRRYLLMAFKRKDWRLPGRAEEHKQIMEAALDRNADLACARLRAHFQRSMQMLVEYSQMDEAQLAAG